MNKRALTFAVVLPAFLVAHDVADHWIQTHHQSKTKGRPGWAGRKACATHVATYTMTTTGAVCLLRSALELRITNRALFAGQLISAVTHYWADRRSTLQGLVNREPFSRMGKGEFYRLGAPREVTAYTEQRGDDAVELLVTLDVRDGDPAGWDNPSLGTGAYALDQSWHWFWLGVAALVTAVGS